MIVLALKNRALQKSATNNRSFKCKKVFAFVLFIGRTFYVVMYDDWTSAFIWTRGSYRRTSPL